MPTSRKQKKARKCKEVEMLSDIEILEVMLGEKHSERDEREISFHGRRPESHSYDTLLTQNALVIFILILMKRKTGLTPRMDEVQEKQIQAVSLTDCQES